MNYKQCGTLQNESIVIRVTQEDKSLIKLIADKRAITMSDVIREALLANETIKPKYTAF